MCFSSKLPFLDYEFLLHFLLVSAEIISERIFIFLFLLSNVTVRYYCGTWYTRLISGFQHPINLLSNAFILSGLYFDEVKLFKVHTEYKSRRYTSINVI